MDVASTLRREREAAAAQLDLGQTKALLRRKLRETAEVTGEKVTDAEIEVAIDHYYRTLHRYEDPEPSWKTRLAHLYIRRVPIGIALAVLAAIGIFYWWLFFAASGPFSEEGRARRAAEQEAEAQAAARRSAASEREQVGRLVEQFEAEYRKVMAIAEEPAARAAAEQDKQRFDAVDAWTADALRISVDKMRERFVKLSGSYSIRVVSRPGELSGTDARVERTGQLSGYYLIVEAVTPAGEIIGQSIRDAETRQLRRVRKWGEQVPKAVFDRVAADKRADGIVDDDLFAVKREGWISLQVVMVGADGQPLERGRQITEGL